MPGLVERDTGVCVLAPNLRWADVPVVKQFGDALRIPVTVWNTPHASAFAEARLGVARDVETFVWLYVGPGVGSAIVQDGALVTGTRGFAGEIGHCRVVDDGLRCHCGKFGCLEMYTSAGAIADAARDAGVPSKRRTPSLDDAVRAARDGHDGARRVLDDAGHMLGLGASYLVSILNRSWSSSVVKPPTRSTSCSIRYALRSRWTRWSRAGPGRRQRDRRRRRGGGRGAARVRSRGGERGGGRVTLVAGIDSSTQSCKLEVRDADTGELVRSGQRSHSPTTPPRSEQDPGEWWDALTSLLDEHGHDVAAMSVAGQQHGMVVLDDEHRVLRPAKLWNDTESAPQADALVRAWGAEAWADAVGTVPVASFTVTKLAWLREHEPDAFARVAHVLLPHDWLTLQLSGELVTDRGDASGTGYWSPSIGCYVADVFGLLDLDPDVAPTVLAPGGVAGNHHGAVVAAGTGDNMGAALGLGLREGDVAISLGTSGTVFAVADSPTSDATGAVAASPTPRDASCPSCAR